ncbi:helix-turn-helix domain-containing protein [Ligilactobacillus sp. LYQ60]|uniref:helix-turn-helix domain-containing protein n=1 Tax=unclassified Ligilactobacillus TaxID=2767920 RepID=UPI0038532B32
MDNIGQTLKAAREKKGYTLDDLQQITKIQKRYLIAIEENNFDALPGQFYVRAFVRQYANTVGLDGDAVVAQLVKEGASSSAAGTTEQPLLRRRQNGSVPVAKDNVLERVKQQLPLITIIGVVVLIIGGVVYASVRNQRATQHQIAQTSRKVAINNNVRHHHSAVPQSSTNSNQVAENVHSAAVSSSVTSMTSRLASSQSSMTAHHKKQSFKLTRKSGKTFVYKMKNNDGNNVIQLTGKAAESWCSVAVNGETLWQGTLTDGVSRQIQIPAAATNVQISLGNSKGTLIKFNGRKFNFLKANHKLTVRSIVINMGTVSSQAIRTKTDGTLQAANRNY